MTPEQFTDAVRGTVLSRKKYNKIFCIGHNKTGTTSLETILKLYGFSLPNQQEQEIRLTGPCFSNNYSDFLNFAGSFDAFQDLPFSQGQVYVAADALFPNSRFILSERDSSDWFNSIKSFHKKVFNIENFETLTEGDVKHKFKYLFPNYIYEYKKRLLTNFIGANPATDWTKLYDKEYYINEYEARNNQIKKYFMNSPEKLLVIDITKEPTTKKICEFLDIPENFSIEMPHANKTERHENPE